MRKLLLAVFLVVLPLHSSAMDVVESDPFAVAKIVVPPAFPKGATLAPGQEVKVEVHGTITALGELKSPRFTHAEGEEAYAREIAAVLPVWRFSPATDNEQCIPKDSAATFYVWFEMKNGEPTVSVSMPKSEPSKSSRKLEFRDRPDVRYPRGAQRYGIEGETILMLRILKSGEVARIEVRSRSVLPALDQAALLGFKYVTMEPFDPAEWGGKEAVCGDYVVLFCISPGNADLANPKCRH